VKHNPGALDIIIPITLVEAVQSLNALAFAYRLKARPVNLEHRPIASKLDAQPSGGIVVLSHRVITEQYVWPEVLREIMKWAKVSFFMQES